MKNEKRWTDSITQTSTLLKLLTSPWKVTIETELDYRFPKLWLESNCTIPTLSSVEESKIAYFKPLKM